MAKSGPQMGKQGSWPQGYICSGVPGQVIFLHLQIPNDDSIYHIKMGESKEMVYVQPLAQEKGLINGNP